MSTSLVFRNTGLKSAGPVITELLTDSSTPSAKPFMITSSTCRGYLVPSSECVVNLSFTADRVGEYAAELRMVDDKSFCRVALRGRVTAILRVEPLGRVPEPLRSNPEGITCGQTCEFSFAAPVVNVAIPPGNERYFVGWRGICAARRFSCDVTLDQPVVTVRPEFQPSAFNWIATYPSAGDVHDMAIGPTGDVYLAAPHAISRYRADGSFATLARDLAAEFYAIASDSIGRLSVVGRTPFPNADILIRQYRPDGKLIWEHTHDGPKPTGSSDLARDIAVDGYDNIIAVGWEQIGQGNDNAWIRKLDRAGREVWTRTHDGPVSGVDMAWTVSVSKNGTVAVSISEERGRSSVLLFQPDGMPGPRIDPLLGGVQRVALSDNRIAVLLSTVDLVEVASFDYSGYRAWSTPIEAVKFNAYYQDHLGLAVRDDGVMVVASIVDGVASRDAHLIVLNPDGLLLASELFGSLVADEEAVDVAVAPDGSVFIFARASDSSVQIGSARY